MRLVRKAASDQASSPARLSGKACGHPLSKCARMPGASISARQLDIVESLSERMQTLTDRLTRLHALELQQKRFGASNG